MNFFNKQKLSKIHTNTHIHNVLNYWWQEKNHAFPLSIYLLVFVYSYVVFIFTLLIYFNLFSGRENEWKKNPIHDTWFGMFIVKIEIRKWSTLLSMHYWIWSLFLDFPHIINSHHSYFVFLFHFFHMYLIVLINFNVATV